MGDLVVAYRPMIERDRRWVISSWLDAFRDSHFAGLIAMERWYPSMWPEMDALVNRQGCRTMIACNQDEEDQLLGFLVADTKTEPNPPIVFFTYVKGPFRQAGIATGLFRSMGIDPERQFDYTHKTALASLLQQKFVLASWQPMLARFPKGKGIRR